MSHALIDVLFEVQGKRLDALEYPCKVCGEYHKASELTEEYETSQFDGRFDVILLCKKHRKK
jgi:hypothetical protein